MFFFQKLDVCILKWGYIMNTMRCGQQHVVNGNCQCASILLGKDLLGSWKMKRIIYPNEIRKAYLSLFSNSMRFDMMSRTPLINPPVILKFTRDEFRCGENMTRSHPSHIFTWPLAKAIRLVAPGCPWDGISMSAVCRPIIPHWL